MVKYYNGLVLDGSTPYMFLDFDGVFNALNTSLVYLGDGDSRYDDAPENWGYVRKPIVGDGFFVPDNTATVNFSNRMITIQWSSEMVERMNEIIGLGKIVPVLLSTWRDVGVDVLMPLMGLNVDKWLDFGFSTLTVYEDGKFRELENLYSGLGREGNPCPPFVWVDDVATTPYHNLNNPNNQKVAREFNAPDSLIVKTDPEVGLSEYQVSRIADFVAGL